MTAPLTPAACDLRDFPRMMIDIPRLFGSQFNAKATDAEWRFGVTLWLKAFHQVPAGSLPDDDEQLARQCELGRDVKAWRKVRAGALRGWVPCDDGRLYHPVVSEMALECWIDKLLQRVSGGIGNARRWKGSFDPKPVQADLAEAADCMERLNARSRSLPRARRHEQPGDPEPIPEPSPPDRPPIAVGSQGKGSEGTTLPEGATSAAPVDPNKEAWSRAAVLLTGRGRMKPTQARAFFGKLLRDHSLDARDLLTTVVGAEGTGTQEPQAYLTRAAAAVAQRRGKPSSTGPAGWGDAEWTVAVRDAGGERRLAGGERP